MHNILLPEGLKIIGIDSFWNSGLEEIILPSSVKSIEPCAFYGCKQLKSVRLNEGLEKLGEKQVVDGHNWVGAVFWGTAIETITLPRTLMKIDKDTFKDCENLRTIYVEDGCEASLLLAEVPDST